VAEIIEYAEEPSQKGLVIMNTPSAACESMTGLLAGGSISSFSQLDEGMPSVHRFRLPVKVTGNPNTAKAMIENIDLDVSSIITVGESRSRLQQNSGRSGQDCVWQIDTL